MYARANPHTTIAACTLLPSLLQFCLLQLLIDITVDDTRYQGSLICPSCLQICYVSSYSNYCVFVQLKTYIVVHLRDVHLRVCFPFIICISDSSIFWSDCPTNQPIKHLPGYIGCLATDNSESAYTIVVINVWISTCLLQDNMGNCTDGGEPHSNIVNVHVKVWSLAVCYIQ